MTRSLSTRVRIENIFISTIIENLFDRISNESSYGKNRLAAKVICILPRKHGDPDEKPSTDIVRETLMKATHYQTMVIHSKPSTGSSGWAIQVLKMILWG